MEAEATKVCGWDECERALGVMTSGGGGGRLTQATPHPIYGPSE
jgi:hypothetical protein